MINNVIGQQRILILAVLLILNVAAYASNAYYLEDERRKAVQKNSNIVSQVRKIQRETADIIEQSAEVKEKVVVFDKLLEEGFVNDQNRVTVRDSFGVMAGVTQLIDATYDVSSAKIIENPTLKKVGYNLLQSKASIQLSSIDDVKIYNFAYLVANRYPGLVNIKSLQLTKDVEVTLDALRTVNSVSSRPFVTGNLEFEWVSVSPIKKDDGGDRR